MTRLGDQQEHNSFFTEIWILAIPRFRYPFNCNPDCGYFNDLVVKPDWIEGPVITVDLEYPNNETTSGPGHFTLLLALARRGGFDRLLNGVYYGGVPLNTHNNFCG